MPLGRLREEGQVPHETAVDRALVLASRATNAELAAQDLDHSRGFHRHRVRDVGYSPVLGEAAVLRNLATKTADPLAGAGAGGATMGGIRVILG